LDGFSWNLLMAAGGIALTHTLLGPDHYLPFVMLARARGWSARRTAIVTALCGIGHVGSSLVLGGVGILLGVAVSRLAAFEEFRGDLAAWALVAFGIAYAAWGVRQALRRGRDMHPHTHGGHIHIHPGSGAVHTHDGVAEGSSTTFWVLFTVFVLGPCEPLIPLFMLPASRGRWGLALATAALFGALTLVAMVAVTLLGLKGLTRLSSSQTERWAHAAAGTVIALSGASIIALGL